MIFTDLETLLCEEKEEILIININRPDKLNALSEQVLNELKVVLIEIERDFSYKYKGIILTGAGDKAFIAGADIQAMDEMNAEEGKAFALLGQEVTLLMESSPIPIIACVNGFALGGGCEMAMACDFIYATEKALFGQPEVNLGLIPGFGGTQRLMRHVGVARSRELIYTGRNIKIEEAQNIGLVQKVFATKEEMINGAMETFKIIKTKSPLIISKCKDVIRSGEGLEIHKGLELEREAFRFIFTTKDKSEGVKAFLEKRTPQFQGK
ncbi:MAG: enoyl-CoA hydratase-related protein [Bdellovibrionales bacterium]|jgi:enoyl-CoA hydratase|nr:enoyl-CoA hydratase-related protein [Bdellovibrionales bacterium]